MPTTTQVSLQDIARMAGTSTATVSRALSGRGPVSQQALERVRRAVRDTGYVPNAAARALARAHAAGPGLVHNTIAVVDSSRMHFLVSEAHQGIRDATRDSEVSVTLAPVTREELATKEVPSSMTRARIDGLLVHPGRGMDYRRFKEIIPTVMFISPPRHWAEFPVVACDNRIGIAALFGHLRELGHRRIEFLSMNLRAEHPHIPYMQRCEAFDVAAAGLPISVRDVGGEFEAIRLYAAEFARRPSTDRPTAILASSDGIAVKLLHGLAAHGVRVPQDVSVAGFDGLPVSEDAYPPLTTWQPDWRLIGRLAVRTLVELICGEKVAASTLIGGKLIVRQSTGPTPGGQS